jgi:hypothetical protein
MLTVPQLGWNVFELVIGPIMVANLLVSLISAFVVTGPRMISNLGVDLSDLADAGAEEASMTPTISPTAV